MVHAGLHLYSKWIVSQNPRISFKVITSSHSFGRNFGWGQKNVAKRPLHIATHAYPSPCGTHDFSVMCLNTGTRMHENIAALNVVKQQMYIQSKLLVIFSKTTTFKNNTS